MSFKVPDLLDILDLEQLEENIFRGRSPDVGWQRVFGGLVIAQALVAAARTVAGRPTHSLHGYFILPGDPQVPIVYEVDRLRDGKSFTTRRCVAIQHGAAIFTLAASFQVEEKGFDYAAAMPSVPAPDDLPGETELMQRFAAHMPAGARRYFERERPLELRPVDLSRYAKRPGDQPADPVQHIWMRTTGRLPDDPAVHRAVLAYMSDMTLLDTALIAHNRSLFEPDLQVASLDHALWFHRPFRADDWLLYAQESPSSSGARGLTRGSLFRTDGTLVASVAQEGLIRQR
jgi:acyl-CoA thioesterase II